MKKVLVLLFATFLGIALIGCNTSQEEGATLLGVDINPSIEFLLDEDGNVESVQFNNDDAEIVASDLSFIGLPYAEAIDLFINEAVEAGYIDVESTNNNVIITVGNEDAGRAEELQAAAEERAQTYLEENKISGAVLNGEDVYDEKVALAEQYDITIGKVQMIHTVLRFDDTETFESLADLTMEELAVLIREAHQASMEDFVANRKADAQAIKDEMVANVKAEVDAFRASVEAGEIATPDYDAIKANHLANIEAMINAYRTRANNIKDEAMSQVDPGDYAPVDTTSGTLLGVDINPSIEFLLDEDGNVESVQFNNDDAEIVASDLSFIGLPYAEAIDLFIIEAVEAGYIDVETTNNNIIITVGNEDAEIAEEIKTAAKNRAQTYLEENKIGAAVLDGEDVYDEKVALAEEYNITIGKVQMIHTVLKFDDTETFESLVVLTMEELAVLIREAHQASMDDFVANRKADAQAIKDEMVANVKAEVDAFRASVEAGEIATPDYDAIKANHLANIEAMISAYRTRANNIKEEAMNQVDPGDYVPDDTTSTGTILGVDINPSIEFLLDEDGIVVSVQFNNDDAEIVGADLSFIGLPYAEAIDLFINEAVEAGYIDVETMDNNVIITVGNEDAVKAEELKTAAKNRAQAYLEENKIPGAVLSAEDVYDEKAALAEEYNITIGKVQMINTVLKFDDTETFESLVDLTMEELAMLVKEAHEASMEEFVANRKADAQAIKDEMVANAKAKVDAFRDSVEAGEVETPDYDAIKADHLANIEEMINAYKTRANNMKENAMNQVDPGDYIPDDNTTEVPTTEVPTTEVPTTEETTTTQ